MVTKRILIPATVVALAAGLATAPPASAAARCDGAYVRTCVNVVGDGYYLRESASITDTAAGSDYTVAVSGLILQQKRGTKWEKWTAGIDDADGWHATSDSAAPANRTFCRGFETITVRARATMKWKRAGSSVVTSEYAYSYPESVPCFSG